MHYNIKGSQTTLLHVLDFSTKSEENKPASVCCQSRGAEVDGLETHGRLPAAAQHQGRAGRWAACGLGAGGRVFSLLGWSDHEGDFSSEKRRFVCPARAFVNEFL